jgi:YD repeat-containing protein
MTSQTNALNGVTTFFVAIQSSRLVRTTTYPDLGTRVETFYRDGSLERLTGNAVHPVRYDYGVESDGGVQRPFVTETKLDASGNTTSEWVKTYFDLPGRDYKTVHPGGAFSQRFFNNLGRLWKERDPDNVITLYQYNAKGELEYTALDINRNNVIDFSGTDRITRVRHDFLSNYGTTVRRTRQNVWGTDGSNTSVLAGTSESSVDGLKTWQTVDNAVTRAETVFNPAIGLRKVTRFAPNNAYTVSTNLYGRLESVTQFSSTGAQVGRKTYQYDTHGRLWNETDARTGTTTYGYNNADQVTTVTTPAPGPGYSAQTTTTAYNNSLRPFQVVQSDGTIVNNTLVCSNEPGAAGPTRSNTPTIRRGG